MHTLSLFLLGILPIIVLADIGKHDQSLLTNRSRIFEGEREFSITMLKQIRKNNPNGNMFFSPYSVYNALLIAFFASSGTTEAQLVNGLYLNWASSKGQVLGAYAVQKKLDDRRAFQNPLQLSSANRIFVDEKVKVVKKFKTLLNDEIKQTDFKNKPMKSLQEINDWIANKTYNQIHDILSSEEITSNTMLVLANAAYMKGQWLSQFKVERTTPKPFYITPNQQEVVPMMRQKGTFKMNIAENLQSQILRLPFRTQYEWADKLNATPDNKSDVSMVLILPSSSEVSIDDVITRLDATLLENLIETSVPREIELSLPKFQFEQRTGITPILANMGITQMFTGDATFDDLTFEHVSFDDAQHVAKIKVDEMGTTAAAATVLFSSRSARPADPNQFNCDHPFLFLIYDHKVKTILFAGVYSDPREMQH
ncbi:serine protease inhibitor 88Ea [Drosophila gunungcola]|uniref:serine protease inhibitor 88Ea n=1 Tax=Drosophila gunungcola TaxID=103775 RepID=UPI0022E2042C|nr:serine protease inhibitor 88Ea [Drosophila gunungcola]